MFIQTETGISMCCWCSYEGGGAGEPSICVQLTEPTLQYKFRDKNQQSQS